MPATRRSARLLSTPSGPTSANGQLLTPDSAPPSIPSAALPLPGNSPSGRLTFRATRRRAGPLSAKAKVALPPTPKSPASLPAGPEAILAGPSSPTTTTTLSNPASLPPAASSITSTMVPPVLSFSFDAARDHLIAADPRFGPLFATYRVTPYQDLAEPVDIWRSLVSSLLGQQISWLAARSIKHKFIRLFFPAALPEKHDPTTASAYEHLFPTPEQVLALPGDRILTLKAAGLSTRKAEYVLGLAERFADGSLSAARLTAATDDEVREMLIAIRGIGPWTVDMFQMFSLHRPDILPTGDLGVQKGLLSWIIQSHDPKTPLSLAVPPAPTTPHSLPSHSSTDGGGAPNYPPAFSLTTPLSPSTTPAQLPPHLALPTPAASTSTSPASTLHNLAPALPVYAPRPLPEGLTLELLKSRLAGKKAKGGAYLTPAEMEALTESWRPFRSIGVWFQWKVCDED